MDDDYLIEDILLPSKRKKGIKSGDKGHRVERLLCKVLVDRFGPGFSRSIGSGNRWGQVSNLPKHAHEVFSGDLIVPEGFLWVFECKGGYNNIDLNTVFDGGNAEVDAFLKQAEDSANRTSRKPMLSWKKDHKPWVAFVRTKDLPLQEALDVSQYVMIYKEWTVIGFKDLLKKDDTFWRS